jgi:ADP-ribose pyrophosphatase
MIPCWGQKIKKFMNIARPKSKQEMPEDAKRVFKGKIFDVYQWEQEMFDGTKATFEKLKRSDTAVVIGITKDKKVITTIQEQPGKDTFLGFAGGRFEEGESPIEAAEREMMEETGYKAREYVLLKAMQPISKVDWAIYIFIGKDCERVNDQSLDSGEKIEVKLIDFDEFINMVVDNKFVQEIELTMEILKAKIDPKRMEEMRKMFLG